MNTKSGRVQAEEMSTNSQVVEYHTKCGNEEFKYRHFKKAIVQYRLALKHDPSNPHVVSNLTFALICQKKFDEAESVASCALKENEEIHQLKYLIGIIYAQRKEWKKALEYFERIPSGNRAYLEARLGIAKCLIKLDRKNEADECLEELLKDSPGDTRSASLFLPELLHRGELEKGIEICKRGKRTHGNNVFWCMWLGKLYKHAKKIDLASSEYSEVIKIAPDMSAAYQHLGIIESRRQNFEKALKFLKKAVELSPRSATAWYNLGQLFWKRGNFTEARDAYQEAVRIKPGFTQAYHGLVRTLIRIDDLNEQ